MKHSVNIFLNDNNYSQVKDLIEKRKISYFINELLEEKLNEKKKLKNEFQYKLAEGYKRVAKNQKKQKEMAIWDETINDMWTKKAK